ncbi:site-specific DNA-methyltransferase [Rhodococcus sp. NPDC003318]|uniref:site-specific DNA-methyltransferase n=1 Tax=Rhodococcus sp. NPDC003318 TaxID=3364503 RepID=UPI00369A01FD
MSRLSELLRQARKADAQLGADLEAEIAALTNRRTFGLVFERHLPEAVELPGRAVRRGDKVRVLPPRGDSAAKDQRLWRVTRIERTAGNRVAHIAELGPETAETRTVLVADLVVVAEFDDRIFPGLVETGRVEQGDEKPFHSVINAENFHALEMLTYTHRHSIDAIYIDPPYNTGAKDWKYNNNYVENDDDYRHSKWLAFMERRLKVARELLNPDDSVLIVTIDEKEYLRLGLLLDQTFPGIPRQMVSIVINPNGVSRGSELARVEEYAFFLFFGTAGPSPVVDTLLESSEATEAPAEARWERLMRGGSNSRRQDRPNLFYPVFVNPESRTIADIGTPLPLGESVTSVPARDGLITVWPIRNNGEEANWRTSPEYLKELRDMGYARVGSFDKKNQRYSLGYLGKAQIRRIEDGDLSVVGHRTDGSAIVKTTGDTPRRTAKTVWNRPAHKAGEYGSALVKRMLGGRSFPFPKSLYAVEDSLRIAVGGKPNAVVLDFFSGSGTTAHAVMRLNKQDGGRRQCISVTNNEVSADEQKALRKQGLRPGDDGWEAVGICDYVTKPRIKAAITGLTPQGDPINGDYKFTDEFPMADGFDENAVFFTLTYEASLSVRHNRAFARVAPILWLRAGAQGQIITDLGDSGWAVADTYGVLENLDRVADFVQQIAKSETAELAFVVTDDESAFQMVCRDLPSHVLPVRLYESYLQNFLINTGRDR